MGTATSETPESAVSSINARTLCIGFDNDRLLYSLKIDNVCGIYSKRSFRDMDEGMVLSDRSQRYGEFDISSQGDQIFIDGNIISAERELKANADHGEKYPGFIPRSFELHKLSKDGEDVIVKRGVIAYTLRGDNVICSNGSSVILLSPDGSEKLLSKAEKVTFLL